MSPYSRATSDYGRSIFAGSSTFCTMSRKRMGKFVAPVLLMERCPAMPSGAKNFFPSNGTQQAKKSGTTYSRFPCPPFCWCVLLLRLLGRRRSGSRDTHSKKRHSWQGHQKSRSTTAGSSKCVQTAANSFIDLEKSPDDSKTDTSAAESQRPRRCWRSSSAKKSARFSVASRQTAWPSLCVTASGSAQGRAFDRRDGSAPNVAPGCFF